VSSQRDEYGVVNPAVAEKKLGRKELAELQRLLKESGLSRLKPTIDQERPDAYVYELAARAGRKTTHVEVVEGGIPDSLKSLIRRLNELAAG
jgi:hypothetical protein